MEKRSITTHHDEMMKSLGWRCETAPANPHMRDDPKRPMAHWFVRLNADGPSEDAARRQMSFHYSMGSGLCERWMRDAKTGTGKVRRRAKVRYDMYVRDVGPLSSTDHVGWAQKWGMQPSEQDILLCLCSIALDGELLFDEWCSNFGYDEDSIKARDTWQVCLTQQQELARIFPRSLEWWQDAREEIDV